MNAYEWDGRPLAARHVALVPLAVLPDLDNPGESLLLLAARNETTGFVLRPEAVERFLDLHPDCYLFCPDAARLHWVLERHLQDSGTAPRSVLWEFSRSGRLIDVLLLDRLIAMAVRGDVTHPARSLAAIAQDSGVREVANDPETAFILDPTIKPQWGRLNESRIREGLLHLAGCVWNIGVVLCHRAVEIADRAGSPAVEAFGPLGLMLQVQGAIAVAEVAQSGLNLSDSSRAEMLRHCETYQRSARESLEKDQGAKACFRRDRGVIRLDNNGNPVLRETRLRNWLTNVLGKMRSLHGYRLNLQLYPGEDILLDTRNWGILTSCDRLLDAWARMVTAGHLRRWLLHPENRGVRVKYEVLTSLRAVKPDLELMRGLADRRPFSPNLRRHFLVLRLTDLELRTLASVSSVLHENPVLPSVLARGDDPIVFASRRLFGDADATKPALLKLTRALLRVAPLGLDDTLAWSAARQLFGLDDFGMAKFLAQLSRLVGEVYPELGSYRRDHFVWRLSQNMHADPATLSRDDFVDPGDEHRSLLRRVLAGDQVIGGIPANFVWGYLQRHNRNEGLRALLASRQGSPELYRALVGAQASTPTGRVRGGLFFHETLTSEYLDLADDVRKAVLYALVRSGYRLAGATGDEFALEVADHGAEQGSLAEAVTTMAREAAQIVLGDIPVVCEVTWPDEW